MPSHRCRACYSSKRFSKMARRGRQKKLDRDALWEYALRALGQRVHSVSQIRQKLSMRAETPADVATTIAKLREYDLIDDRKFSEGFASSRLQNQGFGRFRVLRDLRSKRVSAEVAGNAVEKTFAQTDERELIQRFLEKKYRGKDLAEFLKDEKNLASAYRRLRTAGFTSLRSLEILKRYRSHVDWEMPSEDDEEP